jgi:hypothetical protein
LRYLRFAAAEDTLEASDVRLVPMWLATRVGGKEGARVADLDAVPTRTDAPLDEQAVTAINEVLEGERGSALALVQLSAMASDSLERHALVVQGGQAAQACIDLRALLERYGAPVSDRVGNAATVVQEMERLDERYLAFGQLQPRLMGLIESIPPNVLDSAARGTLAMVHTVQVAHAAWALERARAFAASREEVTPLASGLTAEGDGHQDGVEAQVNDVTADSATQPTKSVTRGRDGYSAVGGHADGMTGANGDDGHREHEAVGSPEPRSQGDGATATGGDEDGGS